jgi:hypothetical protein
MAETDDYAAGSPYPATVAAPLEIGDPKAAAAYSAAHGATARSAADEYAQIMRQRQAAVEETRGLLNKTIDDLKARHEGSGFGQVNLPLMALSAGLLSPTRTHSFGEELSNGLRGMGQVVQQQRMSDTDYMEKIAQLQEKSGQLGDLPLRDAAANARARQLQEEKNVNAVDIAGIRGSKPIVKPDGSVILPNYFGAGKHGYQASGDNSPVTPLGAAPPAATATPGDAGSEDPVETIKKWDPTFDPSKVGFSANWSALTDIAKTDPAKAKMYYKALMYEDDPLAKVTSRGGVGDAALKKLTSDMQAIDPTWSYQDLKAAVKNRNDPAWNTRTNTPGQQLSTGVQHFGEILGAYSDMGNDKNQLVNALKNKVKEIAGSSDVTNQAVMAKFVGDEVAKYLAGGQGSALGDREELNKLLSGRLGPQQAHDAVESMMKLMEDKAKSFATQKTQMLKGRRIYDSDSLLTPDAIKSRDLIKGSTVTKDKYGKEVLLVPGKKYFGHTFKGGAPGDASAWEE